MIEKYAIVVSWSDEDGCWIAEAPDLKYCSAHGDSRERALAELQIAMKAWLEVAREKGMRVPAAMFAQRLVAAE